MDKMMATRKYWDKVKVGLMVVWRETWKEHVWVVMKEVGMVFGLVWMWV